MGVDATRAKAGIIGLDRSKTIAVYRPGALGDVLVSFPVLRMCRERLGADRVIFIAPPEMGRLAVENRIADSTVSSDASWIASWYASDADSVRHAVGACDVLVAYVDDDDGSLRKTALAAGIARVVIHPACPESDTDIHIIDHLLTALDTFSVSLRGLSPEVTPATESLHRAENLLISVGVDISEPFIFLHPGSSSQQRNWPHMLEFAQQLVEHTGLAIVINRGPVEDEQGMDLSWPPGCHVVGPLDVSTIAALLSIARLYVGNDTGPTHLAAAVGTETVGVFGPASSLQQWAPRGDRVDIATQPDGWPSVEDVIGVVMRGLRS
jgi:ADP-heptose:LPS heptosyltransferase